MLFCFIPQAFAGNVRQAGYAYTPVHKTWNSTSAGTVSGLAVWTPPSGERIVLLGVAFSSETAMEFTIETDIVWGNLGQTQMDTATIIVPVISCAESGIVTVGNGTPIWKGTADQILYLGTFGDFGEFHDRSLLLWGYED